MLEGQRVEGGVELEKQLSAGPHKASPEEGPGLKCKGGQVRILSRVVRFCPSDCWREGVRGEAPREAAAALQDMVGLRQEAGGSAGGKGGTSHTCEGGTGGGLNPGYATEGSHLLQGFGQSSWKNAATLG